MTSRKGQEANSLIQFHTLVILFICRPVRTDKVIETDDEVKSLASNVNGLEGEPLHSSAGPDNISGLDVARQQELAELFFKFRCLELWIGRMVKMTI